MRTHEEDTAGPCGFASFDVSSKVLSGTSHDASEEVFYFPCAKSDRNEDEQWRAALSTEPRSTSRTTRHGGKGRIK